MTTDALRGFAPLGGEDAGVLILGSMPGVASLQRRFYYAHPANAFWRLLADCFGEPLPQDPPACTALLLRHRIALWDVVHSCRRSGSLDSAIERDSVVANDIAGFLRQHPLVTQLFFNGGAAEQLFRRHAAAAVTALPRTVECRRLPSSSAANASWNYQRKLEAWRAVGRNSFRHLRP
jgi:double-stranded uracil-DNA glycosylase